MAVHVANRRQLDRLIEEERARPDAAWRLEAIDGLEEAVLANLAHVCQARLSRYPGSLEADTLALRRARRGSSVLTRISWKNTGVINTRWTRSIVGNKGVVTIIGGVRHYSISDKIFTVR